MKKMIGFLFAVLTIISLGCAKPDNQMANGDTMPQDHSTMTPKEHTDIENMVAADNTPSYLGEVLAGKQSKYLDFKKSDYDRALKENKKILIYFYANWCPKCKAEQVHTTAAFRDLNDPNLVGFRVNWRDGMDDPDEIALAKEFGITSQHTKIIIQDGQRILKSPESWDKEKYLKELA